MGRFHVRASVELLAILKFLVTFSLSTRFVRYYLEVAYDSFLPNPRLFDIYGHYLSHSNLNTP
jgi:hypothetical protein